MQLISSIDLQYYAVSWSPDGEYIAFAEGFGDPHFYDYGRTYSGELKLYVCRWRTGKTQLVVSSRTLRGPWTWKAPHTLLYGMLTAPDESVFLNTFRQTGVDFVKGKPVSWEQLPGKPKRKPVVPNVYEHSPDNGRSQLLHRDAYMPVASPNGKKLAFLGSADVEHPFALNRDMTNHVNGKFVVVADFNAGQSPKVARNVLSEHHGLYPHLLWLPDNRHLLVLQQTALSPEARLEIREWDMDKKTSRLVTVLTTHEPDNRTEESPHYRSENDPVFRPLTVSKDGKRLIVIVDEYYLLEENQGFMNQDTLQQIDLQTGAVTTIGRVKNAPGLDWYDKSVPVELANR